MSFVLHHDLVASGEPGAWMLLLHGIFGRGQNWRSFARNLTRRRPDWGLVLVDLREHGGSGNAPPPHTVENAARDLEALAGVLGAEQNRVRAVCGHSFGGKVALAYRELAGPALLQTWVLDASPSARPGAMQEEGVVVSVLQILEDLPAEWDSRDAFVSEVSTRGIAEGIARWLAMNLEPTGGGAYRNRLDLAAIRSLLTDYYTRDLWSAVEDASAPGELHVVVAGRSPALGGEDLSRLRSLESAGSVSVHELPDAGHWLHVDAPDRLVALFADQLPGVA